GAGEPGRHPGRGRGVGGDGLEPDGAVVGEHRPLGHEPLTRERDAEDVGVDVVVLRQARGGVGGHGRPQIFSSLGWTYTTPWPLMRSWHASPEPTATTSRS